MVDDVEFGPAGAGSSAKTAIRRYEGSREGHSLSNVKEARSSRSASSTGSNSRGALHTESAETEFHAESAGGHAEHTEQIAIRDETDSTEIAIVRGTRETTGRDSHVNSSRMQTTCPRSSCQMS